MEEAGDIVKADDNLMVYTDAAVGIDGATVAWQDTKEGEAHKLPGTRGVKTAKLYAIREALAAHRSTTQSKLFMFTDSAEAVRECRRSTSMNWPVQKIREIAKNMQRAIEIEWIPGHHGIPGNDKALKITKDLQHAEDPHSASTASLVGDGDEDDWADLLQIRKTEKKERLKDFLPSYEDALSSTSCRWNRICIRRLRIRTAVTPESNLSIRECPGCQGAKADEDHLFWKCHCTAPQQDASLEKIQSTKPV